MINNEFFMAVAEREFLEPEAQKSVTGKCDICGKALTRQDCRDLQAQELLGLKLCGSCFRKIKGGGGNGGSAPDTKTAKAG